MSETNKYFLLKKKWSITIICLLILCTSMVVFLVWKPWITKSTGLQPEITNQIKEFEPYYFPANIPANFSLKKDSVTYENGILLFQLHNITHGQTISVTEQVLPKTVANNAYPKAEEIQGADGKAIISYEGTRTMGGLFSNPYEGKQTLILLTTSDPVAKETIADMLRVLRPIKG